MVSGELKRGGVKTPPQNVLILGIGNLLLTDDGFGVHVINALKKKKFPPNITLLEAGTVSHQMILAFREFDLLIVIDAVQAGDTPGSLFKFSPDDMHIKSGRMVSLHELSLIDVLQMAELTGKKPETVIIAVQPKDVSSWSLELSAEVKAAVPKTIDLVMAELRNARVL
jgi:hydrogenase maturation protease